MGGGRGALTWTFKEFGDNFYSAFQCAVFLLLIECVMGATIGKTRLKITFELVLILIPLLTVDLEMYKCWGKTTSGSLCP